MSFSTASPTAVRTSVHLGEDGFEYLVVTVGPDAGSAAGHRRASARAAKELLAERSETGAWELQRTVAYTGGVTRHWMRRRLTRVRATLGSGLG